MCGRVSDAPLAAQTQVEPTQRARRIGGRLANGAVEVRGRCRIGVTATDLPPDAARRVGTGGVLVDDVPQDERSLPALRRPGRRRSVGHRRRRAREPDVHRVGAVARLDQDRRTGLAERKGAIAHQEVESLRIGSGPPMDEHGRVA